MYILFAQRLKKYCFIKKVLLFCKIPKPLSAIIQAHKNITCTNILFPVPGQYNRCMLC